MCMSQGSRIIFFIWAPRRGGTPSPTTGYRYATANAVDSSFHRFIVLHRFIVEQTVPNNPPPFRLATLLNRKQKAFLKSTAYSTIHSPTVIVSRSNATPTFTT